MGAIDLLFRAKKDSERLHQLVLGTLLGRTRLLSRLLPLRDEQELDLMALQWEPEGKSYDLAVPTTSRGGHVPAGTRGRILIELKLDGALEAEQLDRQLNPRLFRGGDQLLYLLLGYSEATLDRQRLREALGRAARRDGVPDLPERVHIRGAAEVMAALADPELLPPLGPERSDARDLAAAYRDLLFEDRAAVAGPPRSFPRRRVPSRRPAPCGNAAPGRQTEPRCAPGRCRRPRARARLHARLPRPIARTYGVARRALCHTLFCERNLQG